MKELVKLIKQARFVWVCGNGGSSATAEHFTNDLFAKGIKAICLNSNTSIMTMIANDYGYRYVFKKQIDTYAGAGDLVVLFSVSGKSKNILEVSKGRHPGVVTVFGKEGESYQQAEDRHLKLAHKIAKAL